MTIRIRRLAWQDKRARLLRHAYGGASVCAVALVASTGWLLTHDTDRLGWFLIGAPILFGLALAIQLREVRIEGFPLVQHAGRGIGWQWVLPLAVSPTLWVDQAGTLMLLSAQGLGVTLGSLRLLRAYAGPDDEELSLLQQLDELSTEYDESDGPAVTFDDGPEAVRELADAVREHRTRALAWALAAAVLAAPMALPLGPDLRMLIGFLAGGGVAIACWKLHDTWLARRATRQAEAATSYERVWVAQVPGPGQQIRPLLALWTQPPATTSRIPTPEVVWLCDEVTTDLESSSTFLGVHEAWMVSGSAPRFIAADQGVAILHRRALLTFGGPWRAQEFTIQMLGRPSRDREVDRSAALPRLLDSRLPARVASRVAQLAVIAALLWVFVIR